MRVMVIGRATKDSEADVMPEQKAMEDMGEFSEELMKAGVMLAFGGLQPTSKGKRVRLSGDKCTVIDGPFTESKELIAGYMIWQVQSMEEAVEWVKRSQADGRRSGDRDPAIIRCGRLWARIDIRDERGVKRLRKQIGAQQGSKQILVGSSRRF